jgi:hypothetical protein
MPRPIFIVALACAAFACAAQHKSASGFRLPDGDARKGREAFIELRCHACHSVDGVELPAPVAEPPVPVVLGGSLTRVPTDGELVTAIVHPSHGLAPRFVRTEVQAGSLSRMGDFGEAMTVRQLVDIVAFLHSRYTVREVEPAVYGMR